MEIKNGDCLHVMLYGTFKENPYFLGDYKNCFDLIGFNSNIIAHAPAGIASFVSQLTKKDYFIDPQTYAFTQNVRHISYKDKNDKWVLKKSIEKLAVIYGSIIKEKAGKMPIILDDFNNNISYEICKNVLNFELNILNDAVQESTYKDFLDYSGEKLKPSFLIPPYFLLEPDYLDNEINQNITFIKYAKEINKDNPIFAELVIHKDIIINEKFVEKIKNGYKDCNADGIILWIDSLEESSETITNSYLIKYIDFLNSMTECKKPIILLHGSYLSIILSSNGYKLLAGVGHGIEYGESRPVIPVGGGVPTAKYYFPNFHKRVDYHPDAEDILLEKKWNKKPEDYFKNVCNCSICKEIINDPVDKSFSLFGLTKTSVKNNKLYPTSEALDKSRRHYLNNKNNEYEFCRKSDKSEILIDLENNYKIADTIVSYSFDHLKKWFDVLTKFVF